MNGSTWMPHLTANCIKTFLCCWFACIHPGFSLFVVFFVHLGLMHAINSYIVFQNSTVTVLQITFCVDVVSLKSYHSASSPRLSVMHTLPESSAMIMQHNEHQLNVNVINVGAAPDRFTSSAEGRQWRQALISCYRLAFTGSPQTVNSITPYNSRRWIKGGV